MTSKDCRWPRSPMSWGSQFRLQKRAPTAPDSGFANVCQCSWRAPEPDRGGRSGRAIADEEDAAALCDERTGKDPREHYRALTGEIGTPYHTRIDVPATPEQKARLEQLSPEAIGESQLGGESITTRLTRSPGNDAPIGGLKVIARSGWFGARPSGTENIYKIYAESFKDQAHLDAIVHEAQAMVNRALRR